MRFSLFLLLFLSCEKVKLKDEPSSVELIEAVTASYDGSYQTDGKGGVFNKEVNFFYYYDFPTHLIWPLFKIYYIKTPTDIYALQISKYYNEAANEPGIFELRIKSLKDPSIKEIIVEAKGCGNEFTNADYHSCIVDSEQNIFTYFDLESLSAKKMSDTESYNDLTWDIAFKATEVKLNSGSSGNGKVVGVLADNMSVFNSSGSIDLSKLRDNNYQDIAIQKFTSHIIDSKISFNLPLGIDRVIYEDYWFSGDETRVEQSNSWWIVRSQNKEMFTKFHVKEIEEVIVVDNIESNIIFGFALENERNGFGELEELELKLSTDTKRAKYCIQFINKLIETCPRDTSIYDLVFTVLNRKRDNKWSRVWQISTVHSAAGPIDEEVALDIESGSEI